MILWFLIRGFIKKLQFLYEFRFLMFIFTYHRFLRDNNDIEHIHPTDYHSIDIQLMYHCVRTNHNDKTNIIYNDYIVNHMMSLLRYIYHQT